MGKCQFKTKSYECPLDAEDGNDLCYWHQEILCKKPNENTFDELRKKNIQSVFLKKTELDYAYMGNIFLLNAQMQEAHLLLADLEEAFLLKAKLQNANLNSASMKKVVLDHAELQEANLTGAKLYSASLTYAKLQGADLEHAKLQGADLKMAKLQNANLKFTHFDNESLLDEANLKDANLYLSYIDLAKSLRNAIIFEKEDFEEKEINEQIADKSNDREERKKYFEASEEVYNKLYRFYSAEGMDFRTKHAHYRRGEVRRKLLRVRYKWNSKKGMYDRLRFWMFDYIVLKKLTRYGESILRPILISALWILAFGFGFMHFDGVVVNGRDITTLDYFYLSLTTFTGLGFSNVQPNVLKTFNLGFWILPDITIPPIEILVMLESTLGVTMMALIIFVITYQIAR